jgi:hypothetical protein
VADDPAAAGDRRRDGRPRTAAPRDDRRPETIDAALVAATRELVVAGCARLGIATDAVVRWLDAGAET